MLGNGVNLQWYAMCAMFWALLWRPRGLGPGLLQGAFCLAVALSDPLTLLFLPVVVARLYAVRAWREQAAVAAWAAGLAIQGAVALTTTVPHSTVQPDAATVLKLLALRVLTPFYLGDHGTQIVFAHAGWFAVYAVVAVTLIVVPVAAVILMNRGLLKQIAWFANVAVLTAVLFFVVPLALRWTPLYVPVGRSVQYLDIGSRYVAVPLIALWSLAILSLATWWRAAASGRVAMAAGTLVLLGGMWAYDFAGRDSSRQLGPRWHDQLAAAQRSCAQSQAVTVSILIPPPNGEWTVTVPCRDLVSR
jgi:hypothetical protein